MAGDGLYDAGDEAALDAARREAAARERQDDETVRVWMNHPHGRDLLYRFVHDICHHGEAETYATDNEGRVDTHKTFVTIGERNAGNWLHDRMKRQPELYVKMLSEQETARQVRNDRLCKQNEKQDERDGRSGHQSPA